MTQARNAGLLNSAPESWSADRPRWAKKVKARLSPSFRTDKKRLPLGDDSYPTLGGAGMLLLLSVQSVVCLAAGLGIGYWLWH